MSIEFRIKQNGEKHCYSNWTMNLKSFLTALYSNENPYEALMSLDRNNQLSDDNYTRDKRNGLITYDIDFDRDTITRHEKGRQFKLNEMSKIPLGAAYSLMRFHGAGVPAAVSDCEYDEYNDMSGLFGNRDSEIKDRGFVIYSNDEYFEAYLNYLKNTRGYQFIRFVNVSGSQYIAFSQRGFDNIKSFLMQKLQTKREEADRLEAEINEAFSAAEPTEIPKDEKSELSELIEKLGLQSHSYTFSVVSLDSEIYVTGAYVESADELDELGILGQFDRDFGHGDTVHAEISYYIIGQSGVESERLPDEFECDIVSHLDAAVQYADLLEERPLTIDFGDYEMSFE